MSHKKKKYIWVALLLLIAITILRETGIIGVNWYNSTINTSLTSNNNNNTTVLTLDTALIRNRDTYDCHKNIANTPIVIFYEGKQYGEIDTICPNITITINPLNFAQLWVPLYKSGTISTSFSYTGMQQSLNISGEKATLKQYSLSGSIALSCNFTFTGICSYRTAKAVILQNIMEKTYRHIRQQLANQQ